jgi:hypothetical protein
MCRNMGSLLPSSQLCPEELRRPSNPMPKLPQWQQSDVQRLCGVINLSKGFQSPSAAGFGPPLRAEGETWADVAREIYRAMRVVVCCLQLRAWECGKPLVTVEGCWGRGDRALCLVNIRLRIFRPCMQDAVRSTLRNLCRTRMTCA